MYTCALSSGRPDSSDAAASAVEALESASAALVYADVERVNDDRQVKGWWHVSNVNAVVRMEINDHSWVHIQIVTNIALKLLRQLTKHHVEPAVVRDYGMKQLGLKDPDGYGLCFQWRAA